MTGTAGTIEVGARVELPTRRPEAFGLLLDAIRRARLPIARVAAVQHDAPGAARRRPFDEQSLFAALADRRTRALVLEADAPSWRLDIPLAMGWLTGDFAPGALDPLSRAGVELLATSST